MAAPETDTPPAATDVTTQTTAPENTSTAPTETTPDVATTTANETSTVVTVNETPVPTPVPGDPRPVSETTPVSEVHVTSDKVITDPNSPDAVKVPEKTGEEGLTPIALAYLDGKTPEDVFAEADTA